MTLTKKPEKAVAKKAKEVKTKSTKKETITDTYFSETGAKVAAKMYKTKYGYEITQLPTYDKKKFMWVIKFKR